ncbi:conserved hypothetical protein [Candidatus Terasakiella magnetica]|uniref:Uncharacterized protein n=1 Tax=Candidatus Terasakiella magnetica TaxID=1867952 RepID=A0A1C3REG0_9PROT|nr:hypothetical protein [Candidatus Terasakiella magnetica]SCA55686.1 conserved hypothetical protein [Candidatus Terasakiella magnetica]
MANNAELAAKLLRAASNFFRAVGEQNPELQEQMLTNADACDMIAERVEVDPLGVPSDIENLPTPDQLN